MIFFAVLAPPVPVVSASDRRAILAVIAESAFRHPRRHRLIPATLNADDRFAFVSLHRDDEKERANNEREILNFFVTGGDDGAETEFFLRKSSGKWRIMFWMPVVSDEVPVSYGYVFDYRPLMATGFPARLSPDNLRRTWATKWVYGKDGVATTIVTDVAQLDRHRDSAESFPLDGSTVYHRGLRRP